MMIASMRVPMTIVPARLILLAAAITSAACATTSFQSTWKAPDAQPVELSGQKVIAFVLTKNAASRRAAEDALAREITAGGAEGVASYTLIPDAAAADEAKAKAQIEGAGATGVVVMRPVDTSKEVVATSTYAGPMYRLYWGGYYGYGWGGAWGGGVDVRTNTIVTVETLVYSIPQNKLIWAGQSNTTNPTKVDAFVRELATTARREMKKAGLLK
jgi:hypothetical protein